MEETESYWPPVGRTSRAYCVDSRADIGAVLIGEIAVASRAGVVWVDRNRRRADQLNVAQAWAGSLAGVPNVLHLCFPPRDIQNDPVLPFQKWHQIRADEFSLASGGVAGRPENNLIVRVRLDTGDLPAARGYPLLLIRNPHFGRAPANLRPEPTESARALLALALVVRFRFFADGGHFEYPNAGRSVPLAAGSSRQINFAGRARPQIGVSCLAPEGPTFGMACGCCRDPGLSGRAPEEGLDQFLVMFDMRQVAGIWGEWAWGEGPAARPAIARRLPEAVIAAYSSPKAGCTTPEKSKTRICERM